MTFKRSISDIGPSKVKLNLENTIGLASKLATTANVHLILGDGRGKTVRRELRTSTEIRGVLSDAFGIGDEDIVLDINYDPNKSFIGVALGIKGCEEPLREALIYTTPKERKHSALSYGAFRTGYERGLQIALQDIERKLQTV